jgi:hypothetical protein
LTKHLLESVELDRGAVVRSKSGARSSCSITGRSALLVWYGEQW